MTKRDTKFRPGKSGNETSKWKPGQSGNPAGKSKRRMQFEETFNEALLSEGGPEEAARLLWEAARSKEPWAIQELCRRFSPQTQSQTVILLSQLNRECEKTSRRPQLSDLKETGSLEEDADVVLFVHRPEQYNRQDPSLRGQAEFIIGKQRNGLVGKRMMLFQHAYQRFVEITDREEIEE